MRKTVGKLEAAIAVENNFEENNENAANNGNLEINELVDIAAENMATNTVEISQSSCITQANREDNKRKRKRNEEDNLVNEKDLESQTNECLKRIHLDENSTRSDSETENVRKTNKKRKLNNKDQTKYYLDLFCVRTNTLFY